MSSFNLKAEPGSLKKKHISRKELNLETEKFLKSGGEITVLDPLKKGEPNSVGCRVYKSKRFNPICDKDTGALFATIDPDSI